MKTITSTTNIENQEIGLESLRPNRFFTNTEHVLGGNLTNRDLSRLLRSQSSDNNPLPLTTGSDIEPAFDSNNILAIRGQSSPGNLQDLRSVIFENENRILSNEHLPESIRSVFSTLNESNIITYIFSHSRENTQLLDLVHELASGRRILDGSMTFRVANIILYYTCFSQDPSAFFDGFTFMMDLANQFQDYYQLHAPLNITLSPLQPAYDISNAHPGETIDLNRIRETATSTVIASIRRNSFRRRLIPAAIFFGTSAAAAAAANPSFFTALFGVIISFFRNINLNFPSGSTDRPRRTSNNNVTLKDVYKNLLAVINEWLKRHR